MHARPIQAEKIDNNNYAIQVVIIFMYIQNGGIYLHRPILHIHLLTLKDLRLSNDLTTNFNFECGHYFEILFDLRT